MVHDQMFLDRCLGDTDISVIESGGESAARVLERLHHTEWRLFDDSTIRRFAL